MHCSGAEVLIYPVWSADQSYNASTGVGGFHNEHCDRLNHYVCKRLHGATQPVTVTTTQDPPGLSYCPMGYTAIDPKQEPNMGGYTW